MPSNTEILLTVLASQLGRFFLAATNNDQAQAQAAAQATLAGFGAQTVPELLLAAQTIAFTLAATNAATQTAQPDLTAEAKRRLQSTAVALGRRADAARRRLDPPRGKPTATAAPKPVQPAPTPTAASKSALTQSAATQSAASQSAWAAAFADVAQEFAADIGNLSAEDRHTAALRAASLESAARSLAAQPAKPPAQQPSSRAA